MDKRSGAAGRARGDQVAQEGPTLASKDWQFRLVQWGTTTRWNV